MITTYSTDTISVRVTPCINGTYQTLVTISGIGVEVALMVWPHHFPYPDRPVNSIRAAWFALHDIHSCLMATTGPGGHDLYPHLLPASGHGKDLWLFHLALRARSGDLLDPRRGPQIQFTVKEQ